MSRVNMDTPSVHIGADIESDQRIVIDGHDLTNSIRGLSFEARVGHLPRLVLDLLVVDNTRVGAETATVWMPQGTADLLKRAGWTPPEDKPEALLDPARGHRCPDCPPLTITPGCQHLGHIEVRS